MLCSAHSLCQSVRHVLTASVCTGCTAKSSAVMKARRQSSNAQRSHVCMSRQVTAQCKHTLTMWKQRGVMPCSRMFNLTDRQRKYSTLLDKTGAVMTSVLKCESVE